ncbi:hypothetical protein jaqu_39590 [Jannaschia aquimarina]|uniref:Uncharacterized protein n=1 Tax=Jannaschia aquimarina TaxID=935700 RepID=A0A0D1E9M9_9RHOB|nr:hypothetical protein jaqu_39590 [Jannaschia aquimarina]SNS87151.1 hypothetical protein SAMN05421775_10392 [Jannaschia aquimarina]
MDATPFPFQMYHRFPTVGLLAKDGCVSARSAGGGACRGRCPGTWPPPDRGGWPKDWHCFGRCTVSRPRARLWGTRADEDNDSGGCRYALEKTRLAQGVNMPKKPLVGYDRNVCLGRHHPNVVERWMGSRLGAGTPSEIATGRLVIGVGRIRPWDRTLSPPGTGGDGPAIARAGNRAPRRGHLQRRASAFRCATWITTGMGCLLSRSGGSLRNRLGPFQPHL